MRFEYNQPDDPPEMVQAEAMQAIAVQLERIADELEARDE